MLLASSNCAAVQPSLTVLTFRFLGRFQPTIVHQAFCTRPQVAGGRKLSSYAPQIAQGATFDMDATLRAGKGREAKELHLQFRNASAAAVDNFTPLIGIPASAPGDNTVPQYYFVLVTDKPRCARAQVITQLETPLVDGHKARSA